MKTCRQCGQEKPIGEFYRHSAMADGHLNKCKDCVKSRVSTHRAENLERIQAYDRARHHNDLVRRAYSLGKSEEWRKTNPERAYELKKNWLARNKEKRRAHIAVGNAIRDGKLSRQPCERCGAEKAHAHHEDYRRPLDVRWLCARCHKYQHVIERHGQAPLP